MDRVQADLAKRFPGGMNPEGAKLFTNKERREFAHDVSWVNVVVVRWVTIPERLVVEASVPPSSRYGANLGRSRRYVINPRTGEILGSYPYEDSKE
jgi:hypothetical protein